MEYLKESGIIAMECTIEDEDKDAVSALANFLNDMSKECKVFVHAYRLPERDAPKLIASAVLQKAGMLLNPFHTYFYLSGANINIHNLKYACETYIYFFNKEVEWFDFLAASNIQDPITFIKNEKLSAVFISGDQGADYWLKCSEVYEKRVMQLREDLSNAGYKI